MDRTDCATPCTVAAKTAYQGLCLYKRRLRPGDGGIPRRCLLRQPSQPELYADHTSGSCQVERWKDRAGLELYKGHSCGKCNGQGITYTDWHHPEHAAGCLAGRSDASEGKPGPVRPERIPRRADP